MPTLHLAAEPGEIAETILLPGDPLRGERIARSVLREPACHNTLRNMLGFTGTWEQGRLSIQATGMGAPSTAIYTTELFRHHGIQTAIRVGTCGALQDGIGLGDLVIAVSAGTDSTVGGRLPAGMNYRPTAPFELVSAAMASAARHSWTAHAGSIMSSDTFYGMDLDALAALTDAGALALDMETATLYDVAARHGVRALSILVVTDHLGQGAGIEASAREDMFTRTTEVALDVLRSCPLAPSGRSR